MRLRVLHVIPGFYPAVRYGGPIESVLRTCQHLAPMVDLEVATTDADGVNALDVRPGRLVDVEGVPVRYFQRWPRTGFAPSAGLWRFLRAEVSRFDVVHVTAVFSFPSAVACATSRAAGVPYVVSPRGALRTWAVGHKRWKKLPYWYAVERRALRGAAALHATSREEEDELARLLPSIRTVSIPNGVTPAKTPSVERKPKTVLFLGRVHPVKALDRLLLALSKLAPKYPELEAVIAGPNDEGEWERLESMLPSLEPTPRVRYIGPVSGPVKDELLASATVLVLPSHTENFGQVVVEALAMGTPVVASRSTPWAVLEEAKAGVWVPNDPERLADGLDRVLGDPDAARRMGEAGRVLAARYSWQSVAEQLVSLYESVRRP